LTEKQNVFNHGAHDASSGEKEYTQGSTDQLEEDEQREHIEDPFVPFGDLPDERRIVATPRAVLVGMVCGALVNASNIYLGLKTGWTFTANLFGVSAHVYLYKSSS
jgi:hypothetical protein